MGSWYFWTLSAAGSLGATAHLMLHYRRPTAAVGWLLTIWVVPFFGVLFYLMFAVYEGPRRVRRRRRLSRNLSQRERRWFFRARPRDPRSATLLKVSDTVAALPLTGGNEVILHPDAEAARASVFQCLQEARKEILLESYIWTEDEFTEEISRILCSKAASGVSVQVLVDAIGSRRTAGNSLSALRDKGIPCAQFSTPNFLRGRFQINFRNHRKLLVVDGETAITGGRNYAAEYFDDGPNGIRDLSILVRGPAVGALRNVFLEDWVVATEGPDRELSNLDIPAPRGETDLRVIPHGCDEECDAYVPILSTALRSAERSVVIISPYFVPGETMLHDVRMAALAGVSVKLLVPERTPERWPEVAARRFYEPLLSAGVEIWIRPAPFMHAKAIVVDERWTVVGTANFDQRSFYLNYELSCEIPSEEFARATLDFFAHDFGLSRRIDPEEFARRHWKSRMVENAAALFAPLL